MKQLILGGARSGKSGLAERLAGSIGLPVNYIATAQCLDDEMKARVDRHQAQRPSAWSLIEEPICLSRIVTQKESEKQVILIDCLTLWLSNLLHIDDGKHFSQEMGDFLNAVDQSENELIMVSNEVGMGIVPMGDLSRRFQDESGWLHQALAERCDRVILTVAGLPHVLKGELV